MESTTANGSHVPVPAQGNADLHYLLADEDPNDYRDACQFCIYLDEDPAFYRAAPYRMDVVDRNGLVAFYEHLCGARWWTSWAFFYGPK